MPNPVDVVLPWTIGFGATDGGTVVDVITPLNADTIPPGITPVLTGVDVAFYTAAPNSVTAKLNIGGFLVWVDTENLEVGQAYMSWRGEIALIGGPFSYVECVVQALAGCQIGVWVTGELISGALIQAPSS